MRRTALVILGVAAGFVALLLIGVAIAIATVDPNRFVAPLAARVKNATGRALTVQGPVDFKLSLEPKVVLAGVAFENAPWAQKLPLLTAKRIEAQIALLPLLSRRFEVVQFTLVEPVIALETDAQGRGNWEFTPAAATAPASGSGATQGFGIANFEIQQGALSYRNGATGKLTQASIERMSLRARDMRAPVAVEFRGKVDDVPVALAGDLGPPDQWLRQQWPYPIALTGEIDNTKVKLDTKLARAGTTTSLDDLAITYGALAGRGSIRVTSDGSRTRYAVDLTVPALSMRDLAAQPAPPATAKAAPTAAAATRWIIPDVPLPLAPLVAADTEGTLAIGELTLRDGQRLAQVGSQFESRDGQLDAKFNVAQVLGGSMHGQVQLDARNAEMPAAHLVLDAQDLDLPALAAVAGINRTIHGGKVRASVDIRGRGATPHRVASTMSGTILVVSSPASLGRSATQGETALAQLAGALDPMQTVDAATDLHCAVFRLPLADGIAHVDRSIAIETGKIAASASGTLNFRDETLDLSVEPRVREGISVDLSRFAALVRIRGRFDKPSVGIDAAQSAQMLARIGALAATGGAAAVIGGALLGSTGGSAAPCTVAMSGNVARASTPARSFPSPTPASKLPKDLGNALGRLLGR